MPPIYCIPGQYIVKWREIPRNARYLKQEATLFPTSYRVASLAAGAGAGAGGTDLISIVNGEVPESCNSSCHCLHVSASQERHKNLQATVVNDSLLVLII